jgi:hypothetical protein
MKKPVVTALATSIVLAVAATGCGGGDGGEAAPATRSQSGSGDQPGLAEAASVSAADLPAPQGRSLQELADAATPGTSVGLAVSALVPGKNRLAFGLLDGANRVLYAKSAVYVAESPGAPAAGP